MSLELSDGSEPSGVHSSRALVSRAGRHLRVLFTTGLVLIGVGVGMGVERHFTGSAIGSQRFEELTDLEEFETLVDTYEIIRREYVLSDDISDADLIYGASRGMMDALGDENHSMFLDPEEAENQNDARDGNLVGVGIRVDDTVSPPRIIVPVQDSPALEAGIVPGDEILAVDGVSTSGLENTSDILDMIVGEEGTDVTLEVRHLESTESVEITITRALITTDTLSWAMLPDNVMWVRIAAFNEGTSADLERVLRRGARLGAEGVVLDLRSNPGGLIVEEIAVANQLLPEGSIVFQEQFADGDVEIVRTTESDGEWQEQPLVVLINEESVSAAEVTAASLAENDRAVTIGQTTFGTGTTIMPMALEDGSMVRIGVSMWLTPDGNVIWHQGLDPMVEVANDPHVPLSLPYAFDDNEVSSEELAAIVDDQLLTGYEEVLDVIADAGD